MNVLQKKQLKNLLKSIEFDAEFDLKNGFWVTAKRQLDIKTELENIFFSNHLVISNKLKRTELMQSQFLEIQRSIYQLNIPFYNGE